MKESIALLIFFGGMAVVGNFDYADALIEDAIRKDPPRVLSYTIKQDTPWPPYERNPIPLTVPVQVKQ